ncbi:hypothetical protein FA95DRAFT_1567122 [Auriscalpium vulgare]|uniref:Uncharacterized protein n=1 Tax=Auriscalpium vulgare TaxID=40419 RepID=A0ACB8R5Y8_9AGAM|nr:hypothetical protein FA95DRAFT_1567122 [Auriscalpium vulgare]
MSRVDVDSFETIDIPDIPVARLPPEILTRIFSILLSIARPCRKRIARKRSTSPKFRYNLGWLTVTHVCQRWRNIALHDPVLWASDIALPSLMGDCWAAAYLSRAQNVPLTVTECNHFRSDHPGSLSNTAFVGANLARMGAIMYLFTDRHGLLAFCTPAPLLHTLNLHITHHEPQLHFLPDDLFGGAAGLPELRHLSVTAWEPLSWTPLLLQQLVSLDITMHTHDVPLAPTAMFAALGRMRRLERLVLRLPPGNTDGVPVISLPALRYLSLWADIRGARLLLARLALPAGVRVHCDLHWAVFTTAELSTLFSAMVACVDARAAPIARVVEAPLHRHLEPYGEVAAWRSGDIDGAPALEVHFEARQDMPSVLKFFPLTHLEALALEHNVPDRACFHAMKNAPMLRHVTVKGGAVPPFCATLERAPWVLPALSTLVVNVHTDPLAKTVLGDALLRCLVARARVRSSLKELEVVGYGGDKDEDEEYVRALREAVPGLVVRWSEPASENIRDPDSDSTTEEEEEEEYVTDDSTSEDELWGQ